MSFTSRTEMLIGKEGVRRLAAKQVAVFGLGGVGGHACEALARAGVGALDIFDAEMVTVTNCNRQVIALRSTLGEEKSRVMAQRISDINPACRVRAHSVFYGDANAWEYPFDRYDYVVDAIDTVSSKLEIIRKAKDTGVPVVSSMGAGNKLHPEQFEVADICETSVCPLARVMRRELKKLGITGVKVVYSREPPIRPLDMPEPPDEKNPGKRHPPGSISFVPGAAGLILAGVVVRDLLGIECG